MVSSHFLAHVLREFYVVVTFNHSHSAQQNVRVSVVMVSLGGAGTSSTTAPAATSTVKKNARPMDTITINSPKHRASFSSGVSNSLDTALDGGEADSTACASYHLIQHQQSLDSSTLLAVKSTIDNAVNIEAESLERILENKLVREKRLEMEKKLESLRKKHDKEKVRATTQRGGDLSEGIRKSKFYMNNKLVKRLSSKNM